MAELKSQGPMVPVTKLGPIGANFPRLLDAVQRQRNPLEPAAAEAEKNLSEQRQLEAADAAAKHEFERDALTGLPVLPEQKSNFSIFGQQFNKEIRRNYLLDVESSVQTKLNELANQNYLNPDEFSAQAAAYLDTVIDNVNPVASNYIRHQGGQRLASLLSGIRSRYSQKLIVEGNFAKKESLVKAVDSLAGIDPKHGPEVKKVATQFAASLKADNPSILVTASEEARFVTQVQREHWKDNVKYKFLRLPTGARNIALQQFVLNKGQFQYGDIEVEPISGVTSEDIEAVTATLSSLNRLIRSSESYATSDEDKKHQRFYANYQIAQAIKIGVSPEDTSIAFDMVQAGSVGVAINFVRSLRDNFENKKDDSNFREWFGPVVDEMNRRLKEVGLSQHIMNIRDRGVDDIRKMLGATTRLLASTERSRELENQRENLDQLRNIQDHTIEDMQLTLNGLNVGIDLKAELAKALGGLNPLPEKGKSLPNDPSHSKYAYRMKLRSGALAKQVAIVQTHITNALNDQQSAINRHALLQARLQLNGMEERAQLITRDFNKLVEGVEMRGGDSAALNSTLNLFTRHLEARKKETEVFDKSAARVIRNLSSPTGPVFFNFNSNEREVAGIMFENQLKADPRTKNWTPAQSYTGELAVGFTRNSGAVLEGTIDHLRTLSNSRETVLDALASWRKFKDLPSGLFSRFNAALDADTRLKMEYLHRMGGSDPTDFVIDQVFSSDFKGEAEDNTNQIYGKSESTRDVNASFDKLFNKLMKDANNAYRGPFLETVVRGILGEKAAAFLNINFSYGVDLDKFPQILKDKIKERFHNEGHIWVRDSGNEDQALKALAKVSQETLIQGGYMPTRFSPRLIGNEKLGVIIARDAAEFHWRDKNGDATWLLDALPKIVGDKILRDSGAGGLPFSENIEANDIALSSSGDVTSEGKPIYHVVLRGGGADNLQMIHAFEQVPTGGDDPLDFQTRRLTVDLTDALELHNGRLSMREEAEKKQEIINRRKDADQRGPYLAGNRPKRTEPAIERTNLVSGQRLAEMQNIGENFEINAWIKDAEEYYKDDEDYEDLFSGFIPILGDKAPFGANDPLAKRFNELKDTAANGIDQSFAAQEAYERIRRWEGTKLHPHLDVHKIPTIGSGFNLEEKATRQVLLKFKIQELKAQGVKKHEAKSQASAWLRKAKKAAIGFDDSLEGMPAYEEITISAEMNEAVMKELILDKLEWVDKVYGKADLNYMQRAIIADLYYQGGEEYVGPKTNFRKHVMAGDWLDAINEIKYRSNKHKIPGIQNRQNDRVKGLLVALNIGAELDISGQLHLGWD